VCSRDDDDTDSSLAHSSEMGQSSVTCGRGTARRDSASQQPDSSKEWMFEGNVAVPNLSEVDWDDDDDRVSDEVRKGFPEVGEELKASFSKNAPAEIEYIVIVSYIEKVSCKVQQNEKCWEYLYAVTLLHCDVLIERSGRIQFGSVVQSWNISLGQRSLAESAAGIGSSMIEMTSMILRAPWACSQCGERVHGCF
jgi:hypothetical protein